MSSKKPTQRKPRRPGDPLKNTVRERYAQMRALGRSQHDSFVAADPKSGQKKRGSIDALASRLERQPEVQTRKAEILDAMVKSSELYLTKQQLGELLADAIRHTLTDDEVLPSAAALVDRYCRMFGFYEPDRHDVQVGCLDEAARNAKIAALLKLS